MKFFDGRLKLFDRFQIGSDDDRYLTRWRIIDTPWFGIFVHQIHRPDNDRVLHDHPWPFVSFVLRGGYLEMVNVPHECGNWSSDRAQRVCWFNRKRLRDAHRIVSLDRTPTWTLVFVGPTRRTWGFWEYDRWLGWKRIPWMNYLGSTQPTVQYLDELYRQS